MTGKPLFSVLLTTHQSHPEYLESLLDTLLGFELSGSEIIIVNDNAGRSHKRALRLLLDMYPNNRTLFLDHEHSLGRGRSLNIALDNASGKLIWAPLKAHRLNDNLLREAIRKMAEEPVSFWILDQTLPNNIHDWLREIEDGKLPNDNQFIFNRDFIPAGECYFNNNVSQKPVCELAYRLMKKKSFRTTDSFFIIDKAPPALPKPTDVQEFIFTMIRETDLDEERRILIEKLKSLAVTDTGRDDEPSKLDKVRLLLNQDARTAFELVNEYLRAHPNHYEASRLKVTLLEKLRRHVEASELKHSIQKRKAAKEQQFSRKPDPDQPTLFGADGKHKINTLQSRNKNIKLSIIIPTAGDGKTILEKCLIRLNELFDSADTELIVIDNASIDDTFEYLDQLNKQHFLNLRVIVNSQNAGFAASVNQGMEAANGRYLLLMHNDLFPEDGAVEEMIELLDENQYLGGIGPVVDRCDVTEQTRKSNSGSDERFIKTNHIDSCCMLLKASAGVRFEESYRLAFYEDADICNKLAEKGYYVAIALNAFAEHYYRATTDAMGLNLEPEYRWKNAELFYSGWDKKSEIKIPAGKDIIEIISNITYPVNPVDPPGYWVDQVNSLFTDEVKTEILKNQFKNREYFSLIKLLMVADKRDFLRQIESKVEQSEIPDELLKSLIRYYYNRNIYSRCRLYLDKKNAVGPYFDLYRLRIAVAEKETENTVELLTGLMKKFPCHPELYKLAGDIHRIGGNEGEAKSFHALASQLNPWIHHEDTEAFEIKY